jgi:hypothetical protein
MGTAGTTGSNGTNGATGPTGPTGIGNVLSAGTNVTTSGTVSGTSVVYVCNDGITVTLPAATTKGQVIILLDGQTISSGVTPHAGSGDSLVNPSGGGDSAGASFMFVSDGNHHWFNIGPQ